MNWLTSRRIKLKSGLFARWAMLSGEPVIMLSIPMTRNPSARSRSDRWEPRNPAAPVITAIFFIMKFSRLEGLATDSAVVEAYFDEHFAIEMVAAVENDRRVHELLDEGKVGVAELGPLGRENEGVGVADRFERIAEGNRFRTEFGPGEIFKPLGVANGDDRAFGDEIADYLNGNGGTDIVRIRLKCEAPDGNLLPPQDPQLILNFL